MSTPPKYSEIIERAPEVVINLLPPEPPPPYDLAAESIDLTIRTPSPVRAPARSPYRTPSPSVHRILREDTWLGEPVHITGAPSPNRAVRAQETTTSLCPFRALFERDDTWLSESNHGICCISCSEYNCCKRPPFFWLVLFWVVLLLAVIAILFGVLVTVLEWQPAH